MMTAIIAEEVSALLGHADFTGTLDWDGFVVMWQRMVRRIVLSDGARDDDQVTDDLRRLRERGNFAYLAPQNRGLRERFLSRLQEYIDRAEPGSLAEMVARTPAPEDAVPVQQVPQWLFAFDAEAWATFRALALLTSHPGATEAARTEMGAPATAGAPAAQAAGSIACGPRDRPILRAAVLESLRLWRSSTAMTRPCRRHTASAPNCGPATGTTATGRSCRSAAGPACARGAIHRAPRMSWATRPRDERAVTLCSGAAFEGWPSAGPCGPQTHITAARCRSHRDEPACHSPCP